ncbi:MAG: Efflux ABC transporter, ATP-binding protein [Rhodanobacteraceae bacterium]|jgi:ABC-2 type transport system ATP-binding protein|nr:MAG: Efflux ABC transporter, ATP-binding protein [Rhodanobacteraceae bacterium]
MNAILEHEVSMAAARMPKADADAEPSPARLRGVTRRYGNVVALGGIELEIRRGELLALLGPNGAGKTTAISLMLGLVLPTSGRAELFGKPPRDVAARRRTGAMLQGAQLGGHARVREMIALYSGYYPNPLPLDDTLRLAGLEEAAARPVAKLSGGQQQRLRFALAICGNPELLFLDEPTAGMDVEARQTLWAAVRGLKQQGRSIVLTTHYLEEADALADRIVVIHHGRVIADGSPAEIKRTVAQRRIRCITTLDDGQIVNLPGVTRIERSGGRVDIVASQPEAALRRMFEFDPALHDLEVTGARLEEAFLALTRDPAAKEAA